MLIKHLAHCKLNELFLVTDLSVNQKSLWSILCCRYTEEFQFPEALASQTSRWFKPKLTSFPQEYTVIWYIPTSNLTPISFYLILSRSWEFFYLHRQIGWFTLWASGTQNSGPVNFIPELGLPFAQISSTYLRTATKTCNWYQRSQNE